MNGTMDGYFRMLKEIIVILLKNATKQQQQPQDWKCFVNSTIIDKQILMKIEKKIRDPTNVRDMVDDKWCLLLKTMIGSFEDQSLLKKYDNDEYENKLDSKENDENNVDDHYCNKNHLMVEVKQGNYDNSTDTLPVKKCDYCNGLCDLNATSFECIECNQCICQECIKNEIQLIQHLKNQEFEQFETKVKYARMIRLEKVELYLLE